MDETTRPPRGAGRALPPALGVVVVAAALRALYAARKSLVLDEFHSLHHATHAPLDAFFTDLVRDNHPPLSFLVIGASAEAFGTSELALRLPALVAGVLEIALVHRLVRTVGGARAAALGAAALLATSTMPFDYGTQARMYALFSTAITCVVLCLVALVRSEAVSRSAQVGLALGAAAAFHLHYFTAQYLLVLVPVAAGAAAVAGGAPRAVRLVPPLVAAAALITPWTLFGVREQLGHGLPPGGDDLGPRALLEAFVHLFSHNVSLAGEVGRWAFVATAGVGLGLAALGARALLRDPATRSAGAIVAACAFAVPVAAFALALVLPRAGFTWHYVLPSAAAAAALAGIGAFGPGPSGRGAWARARGAAGTAVALAGLALVGLHLAHPATEDFRGAVAHALERAAPEREGEDVRVVSVEWQPPLFPQGRPWDHYAPRLAEGPVPERAPMVVGGFRPVDFAPLLGADRVVVVRRSLPGGQPLVERLTERFGAPDRVAFGYGLDVLEFDAR